MRSFDPRVLGRRERNNLMNGLIYPRPIAWVSTISADGTRNLAPVDDDWTVFHEPPWYWAMVLLHGHPYFGEVPRDEVAAWLDYAPERGPTYRHD